MRTFLKRVTSAVTALLTATLFACNVNHVPPRLAVNGHPIVDVRVYVSSDFSEKEKINIINGILLWERATNGLMVWHLMPLDGSPIKSVGTLPDGSEERVVVFRKSVSTDDWVKEWDKSFAERKLRLLGLCHGDALHEYASIWLVTDRLTSSDVEVMLSAHEFGHALGLHHVQDKLSVMSEIYNANVKCITKADLQQFCDRHGCSVDDVLPMCIR